MPNRDGTGPYGQGPLTGRGAGDCQGTPRPSTGRGLGSRLGQFLRRRNGNNTTKGNR
ncbi:MAG: DUF5320 domain-containing protein [Clostridia bacterium]|nr:DUF5320 domain-containing protein [Clostridia bacterium]